MGKVALDFRQLPAHQLLSIETNQQLQRWDCVLESNTGRTDSLICPKDLKTIQMIEYADD